MPVSRTDKTRVGNKLGYQRTSIACGESSPAVPGPPFTVRHEKGCPVLARNLANRSQSTVVVVRYDAWSLSRVISRSSARTASDSVGRASSLQLIDGVAQTISRNRTTNQGSFQSSLHTGPQLRTMSTLPDVIAVGKVSLGHRCSDQTIQIISEACFRKQLQRTLATVRATTTQCIHRYN